MTDIKQGNCFELLSELANNSIDMILTDPPYGTTANSWDKKNAARYYVGTL